MMFLHDDNDDEDEDDGASESDSDHEVAAPHSAVLSRPARSVAKRQRSVSPGSVVEVTARFCEAFVALIRWIRFSRGGLVAKLEK